MTIIDKPGFYTSKAGKCEVVAVKDGVAFGFLPSQVPAIWGAGDGSCFAPDDFERYYITSHYIEPRKPVEAWAVYEPNGRLWDIYTDEATAREIQGGVGRLIHLREVEDEKP